MTTQNREQDVLQRVDDAMAQTLFCLVAEIARVSASQGQSFAPWEVQTVRALEEALLLMIAHRAAIVVSRTGFI